jgi:hypothetical protein
MTTINITLTFDDAHDAHLDVALPLLNQHRLPATFFIDFLSTSTTRRRAEWRRAAIDGHELGNHSLFHPGYPPASHVRQGNNLALYTLDRMRLELQVANVLLAEFDGCSRRTFAYPNANPVLGDVGYGKKLLRLLGWDRTRLNAWIDRCGADFGATRRNYQSVVERLFFAARGGVPSKWPESYDRHFVPCFCGDQNNLDGLLRFVDRMVAARSWGVFMFHNIGPGSDFSCNADVFRQFVTRLAGDSRVAVKTFYDGACDLWPSSETTCAATTDTDVELAARVDPADASGEMEPTPADEIAGR